MSEDRMKQVVYIAIGVIVLSYACWIGYMLWHTASTGESWYGKNRMVGH